MKLINESLEDCNEENDKLQAMPETPISTLRNSCDTVHQHMKSVLSHAQQVRDLNQYMEAASDLIADATPYLPVSAEENK